MVLRYAGNRLFSGPAFPGVLGARILDPGNCTISGKTREWRAQKAPVSGSVSLMRPKGPHGLSRQGLLPSPTIQGSPQTG